MDSHYVLFKESRRLSLREGDMTSDKISRIFQVKANTVYITDHRNVALFPTTDGWFSTLELVPGCHYEVHGDSMTPAAGPNVLASVPSTSDAHITPNSRFSFARAEVTAAHSGGASKLYQRSLFIAADLCDGKPTPSQTVVIRFKEAEATVPGMVAKVMEALGDDEPLTLIDSQGNEILDTSGTTGSVYWKQNSRKIFAVKESAFKDHREQRDRSKKRKTSHRDEELVCLQDISEKIDEVVSAAQGGVAATLRSLAQLGNAKTCLMLSSQQAEEVKSMFCCLVCKGRMNDPVFVSCCSSLVGCRPCVEEWGRTSNMCLKCRAPDFTLHRVNGLAEVVTIFQNLFI